MDYTLTAAAEADLLVIYLEGATQFGIEQADRYFDELEAAFEFLSANPQAARERTEITPPVRCHPSGRHIIIYKTEPEGGVLILRVRHAREDWAAPSD